MVLQTSHGIHNLHYSINPSNHPPKPIGLINFLPNYTQKLQLQETIAEEGIEVQGIDATTSDGTTLLELRRYSDLHATRGFSLPLERE